MKIEWIIYFLMAVCICMIGFNLVFALWERLREKGDQRRAKHMSEHLLLSMRRSAEQGMSEHLAYLAKRLAHLSWMEAYDRALEEQRERNSRQLEDYLIAAAPVFVMLLPAYRSKDDLHRAFFANMVEKWYRPRPAPAELVTALQGYAQAGSFYLRQNALEALGAVASARDVAVAFAALDQAQEFHHPKLLTEVALSFKGDVNHLAVELVERFAEMSPSAQVAVMNFLRMSGAVAAPNSCLGADGQLHPTPRAAQVAWVIGLLHDPAQDRELRLACLRYLGSHVSPEAYPLLLHLAQDPDEGAWEFAAVACSVLAQYPGPQTVAVLKGCLSSRVWYVRNNAAASLYSLGVSLDEDLGDVLDGTDAYARDMLLYHWERQSSTGGGGR
ncbi:MAG: HEAT repeat domain-containing protein [Coriobacteriales bacterium]